MNFSSNYTLAVEMIEAAYQSNLETEIENGTSYPKEFLYGKRMVQVLESFEPHATEEAFLAAWCQHLYRWEIPRDSYPMDRKGYHQWRTYLYTYQAEKAAHLLREVGYSKESVSAISEMIEKKDLKTNADSQLIEDVVCLVFLQYYIEDFVEKHKSDMEKLKRIILRTWNKMSDKAHNEALKIPFKEDLKNTIVEAIQ